MKRKSFLIHTLLLIVSLASVYASEREERVFKVSGPVTLSLSNISGDITIEAWDKNEVHVIAQKSSEDADVTFQQIGDRIRIETREQEVNYRISTPQNTNLDLRSTSGNIHVSGVIGKVEATTTSGDLRLEGIRKSIVAKTVSGDVTLRRCPSDSITVSSVSGDLSLDEPNGTVEGKSVSGNIRFTKASCTRIDMTTTSGDIIYEGRLTKDGSYTLHSHSGTIRISLPADSSFEVGASSFSGKFDSEFPLKLLGGITSRRHSKTSLRAIYGNGEAVLELKTFSGNIKIKKQ